MLEDEPGLRSRINHSESDTNPLEPLGPRARHNWLTRILFGDRTVPPQGSPTPSEGYTPDLPSQPTGNSGESGNGGDNSPGYLTLGNDNLDHGPLYSDREAAQKESQTFDLDSDVGRSQEYDLDGLPGNDGPDRED